MAIQQPARIEAMVLVSATTHFPERARAIMRQFSFDGLSAVELAQMRQRHKHGDDQIRALFRQGNGFKDSYHDLNFTAADLGNITADTLIVYGDRDALYPVSIATEMYAAIPHAYPLVIPNAGHSPIFGEAKQYFVNPEWTDEDFKGAVPARFVHPDLVADWEKRKREQQNPPRDRKSYR